ncbi:type VI secretion system protein TssA [Caballeronia sp. dw_276]|jgi:type VI secretion system protein ImpA|uniref:type VI secretion system protein TssA n=1 Tax=Caballeronia sp. dw_276 TaxID=2719795 RepID=UPI001BD66193|nr:type VI secretion system protein TssA [Caballeronia sp. dw_276]
MTPDFITHIEWAAWLEDISAEFACGVDLEYDPSFRLLEDAVNGKPEAEYGKTVVAAVPADWTAANALCAELMSRSRDLRVVAFLARARLAIVGMVGLADGLALASGLLERHWNHVHPQLDANDGNDPTTRINALAAFVDTSGVLGELLDTPLLPQLPSQTLPVTLREWFYATGEMTPPAVRTVMSLAEIEAATAAAIDRAVLLKAAFSTALEHAERIETVLVEHVGMAQALDLVALKTPLRRGEALVGECLAKLGIGKTSEPDALDPVQTMPATNASAPAANQLATRADVIATLDRLCDYYARHEPSSPVPLLLHRARGLVDKSFVDLLKDLAPEGLAQLTSVVGAAGMSAPE